LAPAGRPLLAIRRRRCKNNGKDAERARWPAAVTRETDMVLEDLEHRGVELKKRIEMVRSYL